MPNTKKEKPTHTLWQNIGYMVALSWRQRRSVVLLCLALALSSILLGLAELFILPSILGEIEASVSVGRLVTVIALFTLALVLFSAAQAYFTSCSQFGRIELRLHLAAMIQNKVLTMSYPNVEDQDARKKLDKATMLVNNNRAATEVIWSTLTDLLKNTAGFVIFLALLATLEPWLVAAVLVTTVANFFVSNYVNGWGYRHRDEESEYSRRLNYLSERSKDHTLAKDIRIFGMGDWIRDVYNSTLRLMHAFAARRERMYLLGNLADVVLTFLRNGIVYIYLIGAVLGGEMSAARFVLYLKTVSAFTSGIGGILEGFAELRMQSLDICAVREFLDYPDVFEMEKGAKLELDVRKPYKIEFRDVSFCYPGAEKATLSHIDLTIEPGEKLAIVGLNGVGKTTLVKLLCGFLDPTQGTILLNGTDIRIYNRREYYRLFSAVFQDFSVLDVTMEENIAQTDEGIDTAKMERCVAQAGLAEKIHSLPNLYKTHLGKVFTDGIDLSGGEAQRLMLARALYKDAPIIVLDEPTSALDPIAESDIYNKYNELTQGRMAIYISHRLASTRFCDRILLIADNRIAEQGTHDALLAQGGRYAELFELQSRYYQEGAVEDAQE